MVNCLGEYIVSKQVGRKWVTLGTTGVVCGDVAVPPAPTDSFQLSALFVLTIPSHLSTRLWFLSPALLSLLVGKAIIMCILQQCLTEFQLGLSSRQLVLSKVRSDITLHAVEQKKPKKTQQQICI